ncbi:MAG TPA: GNAT family N-acetyltransferase [Candidatus Dormibacteraeota bacterium]|nr:GNAT family N-acetyltransferase [Candidatus Dormibacteraeota bacterium]
MRHLPLFDIRIRSERLELRLPNLRLLDELATLAADGIHSPETMPFAVPWTDQPSPALEFGTVQWNLLQLATWKPDAWSFNPVVLHEGRVVGTQGISAAAFAVTRSFTTGSWLGQAHQGQGIGREMRAAILHFGFVTLGAKVAVSAAFRDNAASLRVSRTLGYEENGELVVQRRGLPAEQVSLRLTREHWELTDRPKVQVEGVERCLELFGASLRRQVAGEEPTPCSS